MNKHEGQQSRATHSRMRRWVAAWLIISILLTFGSSAGAELRAAGIGGVRPGSRTASVFVPELANRARSISPISPALDRDFAGERTGHDATASWGTTSWGTTSWGTTSLGTTLDGYISRLASAWETIREVGDFDFKLGDLTEMRLKLRHPLDNPGALLVVRKAF